MTKVVTVLLVILLAGCEQQQPVGRYQIIAAKSQPEEERVWVLDTETGVVHLCFEHAAMVDCIAPSKSFEEYRAKRN